MRLGVGKVSVTEKVGSGNVCSVRVQHHDTRSIHAQHVFASANPSLVATILELEPTTAADALADL